MSSSIEETSASTSRSVGNIPGEEDYDDHDDGDENDVDDDDDDHDDENNYRYQEIASASPALHLTWNHCCLHQRG